MQILRMACAMGLGAVTASCHSESITAPALLRDGGSILFIGALQTIENDIPGMVQSFADSVSGAKIDVDEVTLPAFALIDHWQAGMGDGTARSVIASRRWSVVVLQQGPTTTAVNRDKLRLATRLFAPEIAKAGAVTALFSMWAELGRRGDFPASIESYSLAADDVGGILLPIAAAWLAAWRRDSTLVFETDAAHASPLGSYLAALVIYSKLSGHTPIGLPSSIALRFGGVLRVEPRTARLLQDAAAEVLERDVANHSVPRDETPALYFAGETPTARVK